MRASKTLATAILWAVVLVTLLSLTACSHAGDQMVGEWKIEGTEDTIVFYSGRSYTSRVGGGSFNFTDSTHILLPIAEPGLAGMIGREEYEISFPDAETMVLTQVASGKSWTLTKVE